MFQEIFLSFVENVSYAFEKKIPLIDKLKRNIVAEHQKVLQSTAQPRPSEKSRCYLFKGSFPRLSREVINRFR